MRLIDADALIEKWYEVNDIGPEDRGAIFIGYTEIPRFINNAPTVETTGDYISRADAIEAVKSTKPIVRSTERNWGKMIAEQHSKELVKALKALPSADAVPFDIQLQSTREVLDQFAEDRVKVVRCKDCRWYEPKYKDKEYDCPQGLYAVYADDYCSYGERREDANTD